MPDLEDELITKAHLDGYLYGVETIRNRIIPSQGSYYEYQLIELDPYSVQDEKMLVLQTFFEPLKHYKELTEGYKKRFAKHLSLDRLTDWKNQLIPVLNRWFLDSFFLRNL